ncbi:MarR family transcriptional regulator [Halonotius terrestris]|uniref:MarR family transcriptional regulator n=1 Tax=Halonotius terrestris TaxID=2487750 RepID=A0A8J8PAM6_9EURY|nr:helix-turn-helix domain-containing protein [Halonotius terrestris]TQQ79816.1 MarR family transcriptional regulator [Halonotius terrestris]
MSATVAAPTQESADRWDPVRELPPSAKLVAKELDRHDTLTQSQLAEVTLLSTRTVRQAVSRLEEVGAVESRVSFRDARKQLYTLTL